MRSAVEDGIGRGSAETRFEAIFRAEPECVKVLDKSGRILQMNPAGLSILEARSPREVIGRPMFDFVSPSQHDEVKDCFGKVLRKESVVCAFEVISLQGRRRWMESHMVVLEERGTPFEVLAVTRDITDARVAERALRESEERFRLIVESSNDLISELTLTGRYLYASPAFLRVLGIHPERLQGKSALEGVHPEDVESVRRLYERRDGTAVYRFRHGNGEWRWLEGSGRRFGASSGEERAVIISRDVTERVQSEAAQARMEAQLRQAQKMEALGALAGGIAHDFNNILLAIIGNVELARLQIGAESPGAEALNSTLMAAARAGDLVRQILNFSRQKELERKPMQVPPVVFEVTKLLRAVLPSSVEIRTVVGRALPMIFGDMSQIHQIFMNLATNAAHAMRERGGVLEITLETAEISRGADFKPVGLKEGTYLKIVVNDTGEGMRPEIMTRIFEPFFTTKPPGEGTGLGLSVVHGIVKAYDGAITVSSRPGQGSKFEIFLPALEDNSASGGSEGAMPKGSGEAILYVDDEAALCRMVEHTLSRCGYRGVTTSDPAEALAIFRAQPARFAAVITDFTMPKMTGLNLAEEIKRVAPGMPVILTTGFTGDLDSNALQKAGIDELLPKPFTMQTFADRLARVIRRRRGV